jgi:hypothetical protein
MPLSKLRKLTAAKLRTGSGDSRAARASKADETVRPFAMIGDGMARSKTGREATDRLDPAPWDGRVAIVGQYALTAAAGVSWCWSGRGDTVLRYWALVETGGNQSFIFDTNRLRHAVGASQLIHESTTTWLDQAIRGHDGVDVVQSVSGKALLLVNSPGTGRAIIRSLSQWALEKAPGMELTGVVGPGFDDAIPGVVRRQISSKALKMHVTN